MSVTFLTNIDRKELEEKIEKAAQSGGNGGGATGSGLTTAQINALHGMFKVCLFDDSKDVDGAIAAFEAAFGLSGGEEEPDEPDIPDVPVVKTYSVSTELINVTSSNKATTVNENASYTTTLTAADGYKLDAVSVLMGGVDVTADVYADGVISISAVTGNVEIVASAEMAEQKPAELPEDGLLDFFDLRNITSVSDPSKGNYYVGSNGGWLHSWSTRPNGDEYGVAGGGDYRVKGDTSTTELGQNATVCSLSYGSGKNMYAWGPIAQNIACTAFNPSAITTDGSTVHAGRKDTYDGVDGYNSVIITISETEFKVYVNAELSLTWNASDIENFDKWVSTVGFGSPYSNNKGTAAAIYNRTLSEKEIVEVHAYFKTLEVTA